MLPLAKFTRCAADGTVIPLWKVEDVRLPAELQRIVVFMYPDRPSAEEGVGTHGATGFWASIEVAGGYRVFLVTNRHVIEDGVTTFRVNRQTPVHPAYCRETSEGDWYFPSDSNIDLAILPMIQFPPSLDFVHIAASLMLNVDDVKHLDLRIGDDVAMIGRHRSYDGVSLNVPSTRFGHISQFPGIEMEDERKRKQSAFLAQIPSMPGYSGSPVFLVQNLTEKHAEYGEVIARRGGAHDIRLLGVNKGHLPYYAPTYLSQSAARNEALTAEINSGVAMVVPAWHLRETITEYLSKSPKLPSFISH